MQIAEMSKNLQEVEKTRKQVQQEKSDLQAALEEVEARVWDVKEGGALRKGTGLPPGALPAGGTGAPMGRIQPHPRPGGGPAALCCLASWVFSSPSYFSH